MRTIRFQTLLVILILTTCAALSSPAPRPFDVVITNGRIIDGTGSPWYSGDIGIRDGKIAAIGNLANSSRTRTIDVGGKVVAPGFIDMLGQSDLTILSRSALALEDLPGHHYGNHRRGWIGRAAQLTPSFRQTAPSTITITSLPSGALSAIILPNSKSRAWESILPAT